MSSVNWSLFRLDHTELIYRVKSIESDNEIFRKPQNMFKKVSPLSPDHTEWSATGVMGTKIYSFPV